MINVRKYRNGDEEGILKLSKTVFPLFQFPKKDWVWRHGSYNHGIFIAEDEKEKIVGHWAYIDKKLSLNNKLYNSGLTLAAMVHPQFQGKKIFSRIAEAMLSEANKNHLDILYGFPNDTSLKIHTKKLGFNYIKSYNIFEKRTDNNIIKNEDAIKYKIIFRKEIINFQDSNATNIHVFKDKAYLTWRYFGEQSVKYYYYDVYESNKYLGYLVFKRYDTSLEKHCHLVDSQISVSDITHNLIQYIYYFWCKLAIQKHADYISTWPQSLGTIEDRIIERFQFTKDMSKVFHLTVKNITKNDDLNNKSWDIKMGDTEIF